MDSGDNVAIVVNDRGLPAESRFPCGLVLKTSVPQGHKVALTDIRQGGPVIRYNTVIGHAAKDIAAGSWINEASLTMPPPPDLANLPISTRADETLPPLQGYTFEGFRNKDGSVATRNILAITTTVQCVAGVVDHAVRRIKAELLPRFPNVDSVVALQHTYGCGVAIDAPGAAVPIRTLRNISLNPNLCGATLVVSLGCEKLQPERLLPAGTLSAKPNNDRGYGLVTLQDESNVGFDSMIESIMRMAEEKLAELDARRRETCPAADLVVGVQCGGSDAFSGVTANPAVGYAADLLVRAGATIMFSEVTEVRDAIDQLPRAPSMPALRRRSFARWIGTISTSPTGPSTVERTRHPATRKAASRISSRRRWDQL